MKSTLTKTEALQQASSNLSFLSDCSEWCNDKDIVLENMKILVTSVQYASSELQNDKEFMMQVIAHYGGNIKYASNILKNDKELALIATSNWGYALEHIAKKLKDDYDVVLAAVQEHGFALADASERLRSNKFIILTAIQSDIDACSESLLEGYQNFDEIVEKEGEDFLFACCNNVDLNVKLRVANHPNFLPTIEQIAIGLDDLEKIKQIYEMRQDEWLAKIEERQLQATLKEERF